MLVVRKGTPSCQAIDDPINEKAMDLECDEAKNSHRQRGLIRGRVLWLDVNNWEVMFVKGRQDPAKEDEET